MALTIDIDGPDGDDQLTLPDSLIGMFSEDDESAAEVVGDLAMINAAQQIHAATAHSVVVVHQITTNIFLGLG